MILQALYDFARHTRTRHGATLHESPEFDSRFIPWLIRITSSGDFEGFDQLMTSVEPGLRFEKLPRTIEPKDSGMIAEFLVEDATTVFGLGENPLKSMKDRARRKHQCFWRRIEDAAKDLNHTGLQAILRWRQRFTRPAPIVNPVFEPYQMPGSRSAPKEQWLAVTTANERLPLHFRPNMSIDATFAVDGEFMVCDPALLEWWTKWFGGWLQMHEAACIKARGGGRVCTVIGISDAPISNSHRPKIKSRFVQSFGATLASADSDSFHSYGLSRQHAEIPGIKKGPDASYSNVSVRAAISYCRALNYLLDCEDHHIDVGPVTACFWARQTPTAAHTFQRLLGTAHPELASRFLQAPFAADLDRDRLHAIVLTGNAGRIVVRHWSDQKLSAAVEHFRKWWDDLQIVSLFPETEKSSNARRTAPTEVPSPFTILNLARASLRRTSDQNDDKLVSEHIVQLFRAALEGTALPLIMLKHVLDEFYAALVKDDPNDKTKRTYPFSHSRFALIKLILIRNKELPRLSEGEAAGFAQLAETSDAAYNSGRLLAVLEALQNRSRVAGMSNAERARANRSGAGVIERYYGRASTAPALALPSLLDLSRHHLSKLQNSNDADKKAAAALEHCKFEILSRLKADAEPRNAPPEFPKRLDVARQGRFAIGFYHQKASILERIRMDCEVPGYEGDVISDPDRWKPSRLAA
jgi:CRISPR-associated protein Csd1